MPAEGRASIYDTLVSLKPEALKLGTWATSAGLARNYFNDLAKHDNPKDDALRRLLTVISVDRADFEAARDPVQTEVSGGAASHMSEVRREFYGDRGSTMPLLGSATGGEVYENLDDEIELTELFLNQVLDYVAKPAALTRDKDAYALTIVGDSMWPRYRPGERVAVSTTGTLGYGDHVIVQLKGRDGEDERIKLVLIKELVRRNAAYVELRQYNPDRTFRVDAKRVAALHKVAGTLW